MKSVQALVEQIRSGDIPDAELIALLHDTRLIVRANALIALSKKRLKDDTFVVESVKAAAMSAESEQKVLGSLTQKMLAAIVLKKLGSSRAHDAFNQVVKGWTETELSDLKWHLSNNPL